MLGYIVFSGYNPLSERSVNPDPQLMIVIVLNSLDYFYTEGLPMRKLLLPIALSTVLMACSDNEVGDVSLGLFTMKDIKLDQMIDPIVTGVTCHVASVEAGFSLADPSDSSISCRQTGDINTGMIAQIDMSKSGEVVFKKSKSVFLKNMKIRRIYDSKSQTLMYLSYSTKETSGSFKHSLSTVPLWGTKAYQQIRESE